MVSFDSFRSALPYLDFFERYGKPNELARWNATREKVALSGEQIDLLKRFQRSMNVLVVAGTWCGDCAGQCPIFEVFAEHAPSIHVRYQDRDADPELQAELKINGGNRVPVVVFFSEDGHEVARFGERTLTTYRSLVNQLGGESCGSGLMGRDQFSGVVQDWLNEFERVQWILRLSPRLRRLHGD